MRGQIVWLQGHPLLGHWQWAEQIYCGQQWIIWWGVKRTLRAKRDRDWWSGELSMKRIAKPQKWKNLTYGQSVFNGSNQYLKPTASTGHKWICPKCNVSYYVYNLIMQFRSSFVFCQQLWQQLAVRVMFPRGVSNVLENPCLSQCPTVSNAVYGRRPYCNQ